MIAYDPYYHSRSDIKDIRRDFANGARIYDSKAHKYYFSQPAPYSTDGFIIKCVRINEFDLEMSECVSHWAREHEHDIDMHGAPLTTVMSVSEVREEMLRAGDSLLNVNQPRRGTYSSW